MEKSTKIKQNKIGFNLLKQLDNSANPIGCETGA